MKRAAILLPGLTRTFKQSIAEFNKFFIENNKDQWIIDVYLCFQETTYGTNSKNIGNPIKIPIDTEEVVSSFKPFRYKIYEIPMEKISKDYLLIEDKIRLPSNYPLRDGVLFNDRKFYPFIYNGVLCQFYGWKLAYEMILEEQIEYDLVVKTRFDVVPTSPVDFSQIDTSIISHYDYTSQFPMNDLIFMSSKENMRLTMNIYDSLVYDNKMPQGSPSIHGVSFPENIFRHYVRETIKIRHKRIGNAKYYR